MHGSVSIEIFSSKIDSWVSDKHLDNADLSLLASDMDRKFFKVVGNLWIHFSAQQIHEHAEIANPGSLVHGGVASRVMTPADQVDSEFFFYFTHALDVSAFHGQHEKWLDVVV